MSAWLLAARARVGALVTALAPHRAVVLIAAAAITLFFCAYLTPGWVSRMWAVAWPAAWTLVAIRILGARATLGVRAFTASLAVGVLLAIFVLPMVARLPNPYSAVGPWYEELTAMARLAALVMPIAIVLLTGQAYRAVSVADAFLLGFAVGFAADLTALLLAADGTREALSLSFMPPFQLEVGAHTRPGAAYWVGLVLLTMVATLRFRGALAGLLRLPARWAMAVPAVATALSFAWCATEAAALSTRDPETWRILAIGRNGGLTAFVALAAVIGLSWADARGPSLREFADRLSRVSLRPVASSSTAGWRDPATVQAVGWLALAAVVFLLPKSTLLTAFWTLPVLHMPIGTTQLTVFTLLLSVLLVSRFVRSMPTVDTPAAGDRIEFQLEKTALGLGLALVMLVVLYAPPAGDPVTLDNPALAITGPIEQPGRPLLLLFAIAATGIAARRTARWAAAPLAARRRSVIHQGLAVIAGFVLLWIPLTLYPRTVVGLHTALGPTIKPFFLARYSPDPNADQLAGFGTANTIALLSALVATIVVVAAAAGVHRWSRRAERFLVAPPDQAASAG